MILNCLIVVSRQVCFCFSIALLMLLTCDVVETKWSKSNQGNVGTAHVFR